MRSLTSLLLLSLPAACLAWTAPQWRVEPYSQSVMMAMTEMCGGSGFIAGGNTGIGASIVGTTDDGVTWAPLSIQKEYMFTGIAAADEEHLVAAGVGLGFGASQYSTDGKTFQRSVVNGAEVDYQQSQNVALIDGTSLSFGIPGLYSLNNQTAAPGVMITQDGGATFDFSPLNSDPNVPARYAAFPNAKVGFVVSGRWPENAQVDVGSRFDLTERFHVNLHNGEVSLRQTRQHRVDATEEGYVATVHRSIDGFQTWQEVFSNNTYYFNEISCPSASVCYAVAENLNNSFVLKTTDGGDSWNEIMALAGSNLVACEAPTEEEVWVGGGSMSLKGFNGTVFQSVDGQTGSEEAGAGGERPRAR